MARVIEKTLYIEKYLEYLTLSHKAAIAGIYVRHLASAALVATSRWPGANLCTFVLIKSADREAERIACTITVLVSLNLVDIDPMVFKCWASVIA